MGKWAYCVLRTAYSVKTGRIEGGMPDQVRHDKSGKEGRDERVKQRGGRTGGEAAGYAI